MTATATLDAATIREMEPTLLRYARLRVGRDDVARDLVQETWVAAFGGISSFAGRSSLKTWLVSILRRKIVDMHRRSRPQVMFEEHHTPPTDARRERLDDEAAMDLVQAELEALPRRERQAVELVDVQGVDRDEAADRMGVSRGALRVMLHRGRARLKSKLEDAELGV
jgi:RNA polymerase sigma-70 factor (ECF subfamily)